MIDDGSKVQRSDPQILNVDPWKLSAGKTTDMKGLSI